VICVRPFHVHINFYGTFQNFREYAQQRMRRSPLLHPNPSSSTQFTNYLYQFVSILSFQLRFDLPRSPILSIFPTTMACFLQASLIVLALIALIISVNSEKDIQWWCLGHINLKISVTKRNSSVNIVIGCGMDNSDSIALSNRDISLYQQAQT
jgi:hypothetical protein